MISVFSYLNFCVAHPFLATQMTEKYSAAMFKVVANNSQVSGGFLARTTTLEEVTHIRRHLLDHIAANICELHLIFVINYQFVYLYLGWSIWYLWSLCRGGDPHTLPHPWPHCHKHLWVADIILHLTLFSNPILCFAPTLSSITKSVLHFLTSFLDIENLKPKLFVFLEARLTRLQINFLADTTKPFSYY